MKARIFVIFAISLLLTSCRSGDQFASFQREFVGEVAMGGSVSKKITLANPSTDEVQHILGLNFDAGQNLSGHFQIEKVEVGGVPVNPRDKDITIPPGSILQIYVKYQPLNLDTTVTDLGGWSTGQPEIYVPGPPAPAQEKTVDAGQTMKELLGASAEPDLSYDNDHAIHRAMMVAVYDYPQIGIVQMELVGRAVVGPDGQRSAGGSSGECPEDAGILCYKGGFAMELPDIMKTGPAPLVMTGPVVFQLSGPSVSLDMATFPAALLVLKGNGPGEPLEGKPISAISLVVSGPEGIKASGTFDGTNLTVNGVAFRIRVVLGEIGKDDITPGLQASVDFNVTDLQITTTKPFTNGSIGLSVETTLSKEPSGNPMFDQMLGGIRVNVSMDGSLIVK